MSDAGHRLVVGGGAFGLSAALELARRGHSVELLDAGSVPHPDASSTDASKVVRMDYGSDGFYADLAHVALDRWQALNERWEEPVFHATGLLILGADALDGEGFEAESWRTLLERGLPLERLPARSVAERFAQWSRFEFAEAYFNPLGGYVESGRAVALLRRDAIAAGVRLHEGVRCIGLQRDGARVAGARVEGGDVLEADTVVVATGAWTPFLLPELADAMWATGQPVLFFRPSEPRLFEPERFPVWCADIANTGRYGFPLNRDGLVKVGHHGEGTPFRPGDPLEVSDAQREACVAFVRTTFPGLADAEVAETRLCLYCESWDGDFLIDHHPERPGLVVAAGGSGHGFKFAPVLGEIVADVVERRPNPASARFAWREPGRRRTEQTRQMGGD
jgi:glycine/D-amino acid oxidase-like deaminating enzyme